MIKVLNLENAPLSDRNGSYGGAAGSKEGILIDREYWLVKYPKSTRSMRGTLLSYTTSALSEYIGSHIYSILGYSVHETKLGIRNGKLVVACKDFCEYPGELREIRTLKNIYNDKLESMLESEAGTVSDTHSVDLKEILLQLEYNPILSKVLGLKDRFWDLVIIDGLINNNDRNNGNWGLLYRKDAYQIAPVFDNGAAFSNKATDESLSARLNVPQKMEASALNTVSIYAQDGQNYTFKKLLAEYQRYPDLCAAIKRNVPLIGESMPAIKLFIEHIPESVNGIPVCSPVRKAAYIQDMQMRLDRLLLPTFEKVTELESLQLSAHRGRQSENTCRRKSIRDRDER